MSAPTKSTKRSTYKTMKKPNILIVYPDTLGVNAVHCYGNQGVKTPNIDNLAETGINLMNAHRKIRYAFLLGPHF